MKLLKSLLMLCCVFVVSAEVTAQPLPAPVQSLQPLNSVIATINGHPITQHAFSLFFERSLKRLKMMNQPMPDMSKLRQYLFNQYVDLQLQLQLAAISNVNVTDKQVTQQIHSILKQRGITLAQLKQKVALEGYTYMQFRQEVQQEITVGMLQRQALGDQVTVSKEEIAKTLAQLKASPDFEKQYHVVDVLLPLSDPTHAQLSRAKQAAIEIRSYLLKGKSYHKVADSSNTDLGWRSLTDMPVLFSDAVKNLTVKGVSQPLLAANGYHVLQLVGVKQSKNKMPSVEQIGQRLYMMKLQKHIASWLNTLRKQADIQVFDPKLS